MLHHFPKTSAGHDRPLGIGFAWDELPLAVRDPVASLIDINELSSLLSIAKGTIYNWVYLRRIPFIKAGRSLRFDPEKVFQSLRHCPKIEEDAKR